VNSLAVPEFPERIEIELSSTCNLRCTYCPRRYVDGLGGMLDPELFYRLIDEASSYPERILVLHRRGESLLHPQFIPMLRCCKDKFREIQLATNATLMGPDEAEAILDSLHFISFSIDLPERFHQVRGGDYAVVEKNIKHLLTQNRGRVRTQVSMVRTDEVSDADVQRFLDLWTGQVDRVRVYEEHSSEGRFGALSRDRGPRQTCTMPFYEMVVLSDGKTARCNHDWDGAPLGDVNHASLLDIWHSAPYQDLRRQQLELRITDDTCRECDSWYPERGVQGTGLVKEQQA
jgi:radical SAM protein with 4Fe4S-binding SPASM domain